MLKLRYADYKGVFHGFVLKEGYFYGYDDMTGEYIAASGYEHEGNLRVYRQQDGQWVPSWVVTSVTALELIGVEERFDSNRKTFSEWLVSKGYEEDAWQKCDLETFNQMRKDYDTYFLFADLPQFAVDYLKKHSAEWKRIENS